MEGCDEEEGGKEEDEAPLAGEGEGDPRHGERGERRHARKEGRGASLGAVGEEVGRVEGRGAKGGYQLCQQRRALCEDKSRERGGGGGRDATARDPRAVRAIVQQPRRDATAGLAARPGKSCHGRVRATLCVRQVWMRLRTLIVARSLYRSPRSSGGGPRACSSWLVLEWSFAVYPSARVVGFKENGAMFPAAPLCQRPRGSSGSSCGRWNEA